MNTNSKPYDYTINTGYAIDWDYQYKVTLTAQGITYLVNADNEQDALDYVMDYNVAHELTGLYSEFIPEFQEDYIQAGNNGYWFTTYNINIELVS